MEIIWETKPIQALRADEIWLTIRELQGQLAMWIVRQAPILPTNLNDIIREFGIVVNRHQWLGRIDLPDMVMLKTSPGHLREFLNTTCQKTLPEIRVLNLSKKERDFGLDDKDVDNEQTRSAVRAKRLLGYDPEWDFVDLGALATNVYLGIVRDDSRKATKECFY